MSAIDDEIRDALDAACDSEGSRERSGRGADGQHLSQHRRSTIRRVLLRFLSEIQDDRTVLEIREVLE